MKKAFDQTVRDLKREVNKKVLKVPGVEQKVLDATSNEPWGPHGTLLAEIANASRNYHEYQLIMGIIWKRINDTGKNWRHVYKGLTVLEYLVANGSERVIDDIKEHAYQISTLSDFQYIDSSGRDQGNNVRKKSQGLVQLVNDKERITEVRQKAAANRDKFCSASSGGMYRPNSYSGGYGDRFEDDRSGYGKDREFGYRDDDRYGRYGDSHISDGDRYSRDSNERYDRDGYKDDDYRGRSRSVEDLKYGSRSRSYDRERDHAYDDDGNYSSRGSGARADEYSQDGSRLDRKFSDQNLSAPPSYEEAVSAGRSPAQSERGGGNSAAAHSASPPPTIPTPGRSPSVPPVNPPLNRRESSSSSIPNPFGSSVTQNVRTVPASHNVLAPAVSHNGSAPTVNQSLDEFDPRGPAAPPTHTNNTDGDFLSDALALVPVSSAETSAAPQPSGSAFEQSFDDPFGETPFRAILQSNSNSFQTQNISSTQSYQPSASQSHDTAQSSQHPSHQSTFSGHQDLDSDILAGILPLTEALQAPPPVNSNETTPPISTNGSFPYQPAPTGSNVQSAQENNGFSHQHVPVNAVASHLAHQGSLDANMLYNNGASFQPGSFQGARQMTTQGHAAPSAQHHYGGYIQRTSSAPLPTEQSRESLLLQYNQSQITTQASVVQSAWVPQSGQSGMAPLPVKDKFETKSSVWADTLSRGLVNLNISGSKTNPSADIGVDFDALNRKEKRMEKPSAAIPISTVTMGKAMGSGTGMGRAGASAIRPPSGPMVGPGMGIPGYSGGINQQAVGMNRGAPGIGMNMGIGLGSQMQQPIGGGYAPQQPMMGGVYGPQQPMMGGGYGPQRPMMGGGYNPQQQPYGRGYQ